MALYNFHRVLVAASILFDVGFSIWCWNMYRQTGEGINLAMLVASSLLTVAFVAYLIHFGRKTTRLTRAVAGACTHCRSDVRQVVRSGGKQCPRCGRPIAEDMRQVTLANLQPDPS